MDYKYQCLLYLFYIPCNPNASNEVKTPLNYLTSISDKRFIIEGTDEKLAFIRDIV